MSGYVPLPRAWRERRHDVSETAQAVYVDLLLRMDQRSGIVRASIRTICEDSKISRSAIQRALVALADAGLIDYSRGRNQHGQRSEILVLLRHGAVPPAGRQRDGTGTARPARPAKTSPLDFQDSQDKRAVPQAGQQKPYDHEGDWQ